MKKHTLFTILFLTIGLFIQAQSVSYSYRPLAEEGCSVIYTPTFIDDTAYIVVCVKSDRLVFNDNPTMMVRFFNTDQILQLNGENINTLSNVGAVIVSNVLVPYTSLKAIAMFRITEQEMTLFTSGVERIILSTFPIVHDRTFKKDKIGKKLYKFYLDAKSQDNF